MSANRPSRHHGFRGYGAADHDRLKRSLLQPVQSWYHKDEIFFPILNYFIILYT